MTVSTTSSQATFLGNSSTTTFTYSFICDADTAFQAFYSDGSTTTLLSPTQYTLTRNAPATNSLHSIGGTIKYPKVGSGIANGTSLSCRRILPLSQPDPISNQGDFYPTVVELALDNQCLEIQQVSAKTGLIRGTWETGVVYNYGDVVQDGANGADTLNFYMCAIANTSGVWATDLAAGDWSLAIDVTTIEGFATDAAASAAAAAASASAASSSASSAASSASSASTSATTATTQAGIATTQATNAASSASSASTSATTATTQAGIATTQATNAAASAVTASTGATTATTQAGIATAQATNAATSATAAAASAVLAGTALSATSTTSLLIGTGSKVFTTQANKNFFAGQFISAASNANATNYMHGQVTSYSGTTLTINVLDIGGSGTLADWNIAVSGTQGTAGGGGSVTSVSVTTANGVSGSVANPTSTPAITLTLGAITPTSINSSGTVVGSNLSGTNTGDQTITLTGGVTGSGTGSFAATVITNANLTGDVTSTGNATTLATVNGNVGTFTNANITVNAKGVITAASSGASSAGSVGYNAQTTTYAPAAGDLAKIVDFTGSSNTTFTLTSAVTLGVGWFCYIRNSGTSNAQLTLASSSGTIDGVATSGFKMYAGETRLVQSDGTNFHTAILNGGTAVFTSSGTWQRPPGYTEFQVEIWSGGGGGACRTTTGNTSGGSGGAYYPLAVSASALVAVGSTETVTVGGTAAGVTGNTNGTTGNNSTFTINGVSVTVNGGAGGLNAASGAAALTVATGIPAIFAATAPVVGSGLLYGNGASATAAYSLIYAGEGGGVTTGNVPFIAGSCGYGGAGGGASSSTAGGVRTAGTSNLGGSGGVGGATSGGAAGNGVAPAGGGGGSNNNTTSGSGAAGQIIVRGII